MKYALELTRAAGHCRTLMVACMLLALAGCGRHDGPPLEQAMYHFRRAEFDTAIKVVDQALTGTREPNEVADLLAVKGRCFWELANREEQAETKTALLQNAIETLTKSIESSDNAEARHIRAMVYEMIDETDLAVADKVVARRLDESYRRAYINEKPEEVLLDRKQMSSSVSAATNASEAPDDSYSSRASRQRADAAEESEPATSREGDVPWKPQSSVLRSDDESTSTPGRSRAGRPESGTDDVQKRDRQPARRTARGLPSDLASDRMLPNAENPVTEGEESTREEESPDGDSEEEQSPSEGERPEKTAESELQNRRIPGSTWQPVVPPAFYGDGAILPSSPTTGITGPSFDRGPSSSAAETAPFGSQPTTGITGPAGFQRPLAPPTSAPAAPTTGIGAGPLNSTIPSGIPSPFIPQSSVPRLPFTGALPPQHQPKGAALQIGPRVPTNGPSYSPLLPSPLTTPAAGTASPQPGIPGTSTGPLVRPKLSPTPRAGGLPPNPR